MTDANNIDMQRSTHGKKPAAPSLLAEALMLGSVLALSLAAYVIAAGPWLANVEVLH